MWCTRMVYAIGLRHQSAVFSGVECLVKYCMRILWCLIRTPLIPIIILNLLVGDDFCLLGKVGPTTVDKWSLNRNIQYMWNMLDYHGTVLTQLLYSSLVELWSCAWHLGYYRYSAAGTITLFFRVVKLVHIVEVSIVISVFPSSVSKNFMSVHNKIM